MKALLLTTILTVTAIANANTMAEWPTINFNSASVKINNVCATETGFKTINPVAVCKSMSVKLEACKVIYSSDNDYTSVQYDSCRPITGASDLKSGEFMKTTNICNYAQETLFIGKTQTKEVCTRWTESTEIEVSRCLNTSQVTREIPRNYAVTTVFDNTGETTGFAGSFNYTIPACK